MEGLEALRDRAAGSFSDLTPATLRLRSKQYLCLGGPGRATDRAAEKDLMGSGPLKGVSLAITHVPQSRLLLDIPPLWVGPLTP